ncbi:hypothetical protein K488DRAFT_73631 [Vararia minispora EC-137]|uniref:Uncharacterized protein n=1 Tax=Vararia minispora EC-137 TaxID=1314806 RepID=A0ACB8Q9V8_9AGAM|nr:hypothetical protein K488DRAFT_73631 [Vararia minispora EC-137]
MDTVRLFLLHRAQLLVTEGARSCGAALRHGDSPRWTTLARDRAANPVSKGSGNERQRVVRNAAAQMKLDQIWAEFKLCVGESVGESRRTAGIEAGGPEKSYRSNLRSSGRRHRCVGWRWDGGRTDTGLFPKSKDNIQYSSKARRHGDDVEGLQRQHVSHYVPLAAGGVYGGHLGIREGRLLPRELAPGQQRGTRRIFCNRRARLLGMKRIYPQVCIHVRSPLHRHYTNGRRRGGTATWVGKRGKETRRNGTGRAGEQKKQGNNHVGDWRGNRQRGVSFQVLHGALRPYLTRRTKRGMAVATPFSDDGRSKQR